MVDSKKVELGQLSNITFKEIIEKIAEGENFQDILGISDEMMQNYYEASMEYFNSQRYLEAADCFLFMTALNPFESNLWIKYGNAEQALDHYEDALCAYSMAMLWDADDPFPHFYSAEIYVKIDDLLRAKECLNICLQLIDEHSEFDSLRQVALKFLTSIKE